MNTATQSITEQKIIEQLTANTGTHFLDSGGAYGRNWQRNQLRDFNSEKATTLKFEIWNDKWEMDITHNVFHLLKDCLEYDEKLDRIFLDYCNLPENENEGWLQITENFFDHMGVVGNGYDSENFECINTYNDENLLSQVLQYYLFEYRKIGEYNKNIATIEYDTQYIALQIHGGCDIRGGYTRPYIYEYDPEYCYPSIDYRDRAHIICNYSPDPRQTKISGVEINELPHTWDFESACYYQIEGPSEFKDLEHTEKESEKGKGKLYIDENGNGYCPHCGEILEASY